METVVKRSLASCLSGMKDGIGRKEKTVRRKSAPCCHSQITYDSSWIRTYQAELHRERKLRQVVVAQKKAERTVLKTHYRTPHRYSKTPRDRKSLKTKAPQKTDDSFFGAFRGLSINNTGPARSRTTTPRAEQCKVM